MPQCQAIPKIFVNISLRIMAVQGRARTFDSVHGPDIAHPDNLVFQHFTLRFKINGRVKISGGGVGGKIIPNLISGFMSRMITYTRFLK